MKALRNLRESDGRSLRTVPCLLLRQELKIEPESNAVNNRVSDLSVSPQSFSPTLILSPPDFLMLLRRRLVWQFLKVFGLSWILSMIAAMLLVAPLAGFPPASSTGWFALLALGGISGAILGSVAASRIVSPILDDLSSSFQKVSSGDYSTELNSASQDQIEEVGIEFDRMTEQIGIRTSLLADDRNRLRSVIDSLLEGVIAIDPSQQVLLVNAAACRLFRIRETTSLGRPLWEIIRNTRIQYLIDKCFEQKTRVAAELEWRGNPPRILAVSAAPLPVEATADSSLSPGGVIVISDVSELRRLESVRQEFVANASHELKTPLASIQACVETLLNGGADDIQIRDRFLQMIDESALRLESLVHDMLTLARSETNREQLQLVPVPFQRIVTTCLSRQQQAAQRKQIALHTQPPPEPVVLLAEDEALEEIFDNLLGNAVKYTNPGGSVTLRWRSEAGHGVIEVEDTGIGIPGNQLPRIFERFYRVDRHRSRDQGGTGLGLSIVKHLVQSVGGKITVESRMNIGSTFRIRIPLASGVNDLSSDEKP